MKKSPKKSAKKPVSRGKKSETAAKSELAQSAENLEALRQGILQIDEYCKIAKNAGKRVVISIAEDGSIDLNLIP